MKIEIIKNDDIYTPSQYEETLDYVWLRNSSELGIYDVNETYVINGCKDSNGKIAVGIFGYKEHIEHQIIENKEMPKFIKQHCGFKIDYIIFDERLLELGEIENWWEHYLKLVENETNGVYLNSDGSVLKNEAYTIQKYKLYDYIWFESTDTILNFMKTDFEKIEINDKTIYIKWINYSI